MLAMREPALDLSEYDIVGERSSPVRLFAYSGRNLYRPGEGLDVSVLARDADGRPVPVQPIQAVLKDPAGRKQFTATWQPDSRFPGYYLKHLQLPDDAATGSWSLELRADPADRAPARRAQHGTCGVACGRAGRSAAVVPRRLCARRQPGRIRGFARGSRRQPPGRCFHAGPPVS